MDPRLDGLVAARLILDDVRRQLTGEPGDPAHSQEARSGAPLILLVEDEADDLAMYQESLQGDGFQVATARSAKEALEKVLRLRPSAILLDLVLPDINGLAVAKALRDDPDTASMPIVAISAAVPRYSVEAARLVGCHSFLAKPAHPVDVAACLRVALAG